MADVIELSEATKVADVVPLGDVRVHAVPGGVPIQDDVDGIGTWAWMALDTAGHLRLIQCACLPSVRITREGAHIGAVVVHHAFDGRSTGEPT